MFTVWLDKGDRSAGYTRRLSSHGQVASLEAFEIGLNSNHESKIQFVTLAHELAHIYLGHCGPDSKRKVKGYCPDHALWEVEAETVAYLVAKRTGVSPRSESYLDYYKGALDRLDLHRIFTVTNKVERLLKLPLAESPVPFLSERHRTPRLGWADARRTRRTRPSITVTKVV